jgi:hypothetical protein
MKTKSSSKTFAALAAGAVFCAILLPFIWNSLF